VVQDQWYRTSGTGSVVRISGTGPVVQDQWYRISGTGPVVQDKWYRTSGTGPVVQDQWYRTSGTGSVVQTCTETRRIDQCKQGSHIVKVQTDSTISDSKPVPIIRANGKQTYLLVNTKIAGGVNMIRKEEILLKYKDFIT
jgi:hypothetical protein